MPHPVPCCGLPYARSRSVLQNPRLQAAAGVQCQSPWDLISVFSPSFPLLPRDTDTLWTLCFLDRQGCNTTECLSEARVQRGSILLDAAVALFVVSRLVSHGEPIKLNHMPVTCQAPEVASACSLKLWVIHQAGLWVTGEAGHLFAVSWTILLYDF